MKRKKVLFVTEAHWNTTGYSVYTKEVLSRLAQVPELELAELACFTNLAQVQEHQKKVPWKIYCNTPDESNQEAMAHYGSHHGNRFGEFSFHQVLLNFKPDFVMDIRDVWMMSFEEISFFRPFYKLAWMPTVDAFPQNQYWINSFTDLDAVFTYSEFGRDTIISQAPKLAKTFQGVASPCASEVFYKMTEYPEIRKNLQLPEGAVVFGTVMRNQRRKLYPNLMRSFKKCLEMVEDYNQKNSDKIPDIYLYCHTGYPDAGWEIPDLIMENEIGHRTLITYQCLKCKKVETSFFNDSFKFCRNCQNYSSQIVSVFNPMDEKHLNEVYNSFDVYIQLANSEGFGMPQLEAARAGLPIISMYYSAMKSIIDNLEGIGLQPLALYKELETGCHRAIPDEQKLAEIMLELAKNKSFRNEVAEKCHSNYHKKYNWDITAELWKNYFLKTEVPDQSTTWKSPPRFFQPAKELPDGLENIPATDQATWLFLNVLNMPQWIGKAFWLKVVKDLNYRMTVSSTVPGLYFNDFSHPDNVMEMKHQRFDIKMAFDIFSHLRHSWNQLEQWRIQS